MRNIVKFLFTLVIGVALIWLGFWWYAESRLQSGFTAWAQQQAAHGWKISYDSIQRGGSIADAKITIDNLELVTPPGPAGETADITLPAVTLRIQALDPLVFHTDLPNKIGVSLGDRLDLVVGTSSIALAENLDPDTIFNRNAYPFRGGDFAASDIDILASAGSLLVLHIDRISSHTDLNLQAGADHTAFDSQASFDGVAVSPLLARLASIPFDGKLTHLDLSARFSGPVPANLTDTLTQIGAKGTDIRAQQRLIMPVVHQWAAQGGSMKTGLHLILGPSTIGAAGSVKFDANLQPEGTADVGADHLDQLTGAITNSYPSLQGDIVTIEARASQYLSNTDQGGQTLTMHIIYGTPGIIINGQKIADMPPVDWNAAENPPAAPVQAPGDGSGAASPGPATGTNP